LRFSVAHRSLIPTNAGIGCAFSRSQYSQPCISASAPKHFDAGSCPFADQRSEAMLNAYAESSETLAMPDTSAVFASPATYEPNPAPVMKLAGGADSARNQHTETKAPGGKDASRQKDGG